MVKYETKMVAMAIVILMVIFNIGIIDAEQCVTNCGNGYCCPASYPLCVRGLPKCCPLGTIFYSNGYCYGRSGKSGVDGPKSASADAAYTLI
jgi:hypothetical protein